MAKKKAKTQRTPIEAIRHTGDTRKNIPTEELRGFVTQDAHAPKKMLYPRDPSLDPQLVWKGKDEQDQCDLEVPIVPIYIQEKIHPQAIIDDLPRTAPTGDEQIDLFADFNGLEGDFDKKIEFYQHDQHWSNRMILGDSLMVMTSLAEKEGLKGKVQCIYLDPPYGIKFGSNWQVSTRKRIVRDRPEDATRQPEQVRAFRDTWELGIHSYLAYLRDRLISCRELLTESGSVFVQIGDENLHLVRCVMDEVFGSENCVSIITIQKTTSAGGGQAEENAFQNVSDFVIWYAKTKGQHKYRPIYTPKKIGEHGALNYDWALFPDGTKKRIKSSDRDEMMATGSVKLFRHDNLTSSSGVDKTRFRVEFDGKVFSPHPSVWKTGETGMEQLRRADRLLAPANTLRYIRYFDDFPVNITTNVWTDMTGGVTDKVYVVQTNTKVVERCLLMSTDPGDLVLDPTCGSGTTAFVAEQWGRRWITCDTSRVALALARTRLMSAKFPYYHLADDHPDLALNSTDEEIKQHLRQQSGCASGHGDIRKGFVYKRVPHVTLKSIANNPDIKEGMSREEIDAAIARHADMEILYDQPYTDAKRLRVTGPFTVESLSPHRTLSVEEKVDLAKPDPETGCGIKILAAGGFVNVIIDNLRKAGAQNRMKDERMKFDRLDIYPGQWIAAEGEITEKDGALKRVAVCIGPEHGTVGSLLIKEAAKEAVQGVGFDLLLVCGFAFDPSVPEEVKQYGNLTVLPVRMNPDLAMGDELLKKTGAGNLFMIFGEPDIEIRHVEDGKVEVEIKGVDVYDPTTGDVRSNSVDDIACWFIDTDYNGESFFVRHAYFTGADEPYKKLQTALKAEIDEAAWESLYSAISRPFPKPKPKEGQRAGKIAVKVINHYGDEVMQVFEID